MTKSAKSILKKDIKKYKQLAEYTTEENRDVFIDIANYISQKLGGIQNWVKEKCCLMKKK